MATINDILCEFIAVRGSVLSIDGVWGTPCASIDPQHLRVEVAADAAAHLVVLHTTEGMSTLDISIGEGAHLSLTELFTAEAFAEVAVKQSARSQCRITMVQLASANASYTLDLDGCEAENTLGGVFLAGGEEHCVIKLRTNHNVADCRSNSYIKGVAGGCALGEFYGLVYVAPTPSAPMPVSRTATCC